MIKQASIATAAILALAGNSAYADVTLYGKVDLGVVQESGGAAGSVTKLSTGALSPSRLGVKANFDLGDGMKAKGQFETGVCADSNNNPAGQYCTGGTFMGRRATLGLEGSFGEVSLGRQFTPAYLNIDNFDPFGTGTAGQATNLFHAVFRANNSIVYSMHAGRRRSPAPPRPRPGSPHPRSVRPSPDPPLRSVQCHAPIGRQ